MLTHITALQYTSEHPFCWTLETRNTARLTRARRYLCVFTQQLQKQANFYLSTEQRLAKAQDIFCTAPRRFLFSANSFICSWISFPTVSLHSRFQEVCRIHPSSLSPSLLSLIVNWPNNYVPSLVHSTPT